MASEDPPANEESLNRSFHVAVDELQEVINIPLESEPLEENPDEIVLGPRVEMALMDLIEHFASLYNNNPFHNFEVRIQNDFSSVNVSSIVY